jgi:hypothetical protein
MKMDLKKLLSFWWQFLVIYFTEFNLRECERNVLLLGGESALCMCEYTVLCTGGI